MRAIYVLFVVSATAAESIMLCTALGKTPAVFMHLHEMYAMLPDVYSDFLLKNKKNINFIGNKLYEFNYNS